MDYEAAEAKARSFAQTYGVDETAFLLWKESVFDSLNLKALSGNATNNADDWSAGILACLAKMPALAEYR